MLISAGCSIPSQAGSGLISQELDFTYGIVVIQSMCINFITSGLVSYSSSYRFIIPVSECEVLGNAQEATVNFSINEVVADRTVNSQRVDEVYLKFLNWNNIEVIVCNN